MMLTRWIAIACLIGCGSKEGGTGGAPDSGTTIDGDESATCSPPDVLVLLDRTASMAARPDGTLPPNTPAGHAESKWSIALAAVEGLTGRFDTTIRFGLALFPRAPTGDACVTLAERLSGQRASNPQCEAGELLVAPATATSGAIGTMLDPETTRLCTSTPIGAGLATARSELAAIRDPARTQYVLFVGDGADTCNDSAALANTD